MSTRHRTVLLSMPFALLLLALATASLLGGPRPANAATPRIPFDVIVRSADVVVIATVGTARPAFTEDGGRIVTFVDVAADRVLKGSFSTRYVVRVGGGQVGDVRMWQEDQPLLREGDRVLLFLRADGSVFVCVGGLQGKFDVRDGNVFRDGTSLGPLSSVVARINNILTGDGRMR